MDGRACHLYGGGQLFFRALDDESEGLAYGAARLGRLGHRAKLS